MSLDVEVVFGEDVLSKNQITNNEKI